MMDEYTLTTLRKPGFNDIAVMWLQGVKQMRKETTYDKYRLVYMKYIFPFVKDVTYDDMIQGRLKTAFLFKIMPELRGCSHSIGCSVRTIFRQICQCANEMYELNIECAKIRIPNNVFKSVDVFSTEEQKKILDFLYRDMDENNFGIFLCLSTGLRLGEICSLKWSDIDLRNRIMTVRRTVHRINTENEGTRTRLTIGTPKSRTSYRVIPLSDEVVYIADNQIRHHEYVISKSKPTDPRTYEYRFERILKKLNISHKRFHVLRHTFATNCIYCGVDIKSLSEMLGHANIQTTLDKYVHPSMEQKRKHLNTLSGIYRSFVSTGEERAQ